MYSSRKQALTACRFTNTYQLHCTDHNKIPVLPYEATWIGSQGKRGHTSMARHWLPSYRTVFLTEGTLGWGQVPHSHFPLS